MRVVCALISINVLTFFLFLERDMVSESSNSDH